MQGLKIFLLIHLLFFNLGSAWANGNARAAYHTVKRYVAAHSPAETVLSPEGEFITCFNPIVARWVQKKWDLRLYKQIEKTLAPHLHIDLSRQGFVPAALRTAEGKKDETNYDAIWVRDNIWAYYALLKDPSRRKDAQTLVLALWDYYASAAQIERFKKVIATPSLAQDPMAMPHIRFNGRSPQFSDVLEHGKPQQWNHRQIDAHGLFFTALGEAMTNRLIPPSALTPKRLEVLLLYPRFLQKIKFYAYEDSGAWEEIPRKNTSSIGLATRSLQVLRDLLFYKTKAVEAYRKKLLGRLAKTDPNLAKMWSSRSMNRLIAAGLKTVKRQLALGGESPDYPPTDIHFRLADAALVALIQPSPLEGLSEKEKRKILLIVETLKRPLGVLRYQNDSYQCGNYWIKPPTPQPPKAKQMQTPPRKSATAPSAPSGNTTDNSENTAFLRRFSILTPDTEAQWFFDSLLCLARLHLAKTTKDLKQRRQDLHAATIHLKRALGQLTGPKMVSADGKPLKPWLAPESINTVLIKGHKYYLPSPIAPLNWAKAGLDMALKTYRPFLGQ